MFPQRSSSCPRDAKDSVSKRHTPSHSPVLTWAPANITTSAEPFLRRRCGSTIATRARTTLCTGRSSGLSSRRPFTTCEPLQTSSASTLAEAWVWPRCRLTHLRLVAHVSLGASLGVPFLHNGTWNSPGGPETGYHFPFREVAQSQGLGAKARRLRTRTRADTTPDGTEASAAGQSGRACVTRM